MRTGTIDTLKRILIDDLFVEVSYEEIGVDDGLQAVLGLDSVSFIEMRMLCEEHFNIKIDDDEFSPENFRTRASLGNTLVAVLPGDARVDLKALARLVRCKKLKFADAESVERVSGYPAGGTPPIGHRQRLPVYVDEKLFAHEVGYGGGGRPELLLKISADEIVRAADAVVAPISL